MQTMKQTLSQGMTGKVIIIGILGILLLLPTSMTESLLLERQERQQQLRTEVSQQWGEQLLLKAAYLRIPYLIHNTDSDGIRRHDSQQRFLYVLPEYLEIDGHLASEVRHKSLYTVPLYQARLSVKGHFQRPDMATFGLAKAEVQWHRASFGIGLSQLKGLQAVEPLILGGKTYSLAAGLPSLKMASQGLSAPVKLSAQWQELPFATALTINATERIEFVPMAQNTKLSLAADWPDPGFTGAFLPQQQHITEEGFSASWQVLGVNRNIPQVLTRNDTFIHDDSHFGVSLIIMADVYQQVDRLIKYMALFIVFTFAALFCSEVLSGTVIHPVQYLLVGLAIVLFYVLLLSLAEHLGFFMAYVLAATVVTVQISLYARSLCQYRSLSYWVAGLLVLLYSYFYLLLQMQDYALLAGAAGLLLLLVAVMCVTRHVDWYNTSAGSFMPSM
ncbi:MAG: cell envelope integrity protein CreD [Gammaproteobacteria bacterium]|nr:cell envelope integrity protein CreD [Gammaproteobacteria bacterium]